MKFGGVLFIIIFIIGIVSMEASECQNGEVRKESCNICTCVNGAYICTMKTCFSHIYDIRKREAYECQHGEIKMDSCNMCICHDGAYICTAKMCLSHIYDIRKKREARTNPKFNPILTRLRRDTPAMAAELKTTPCAPNDYFQIDCNTCYCNFDRTGYLCTENTCHDGRLDTSTTTQIPLSQDTMLIISDDGVKLLQNYNSNDNNLSRIGPADQKTPNSGDIANKQLGNNDLQNDLGSAAGTLTSRLRQLSNTTSANVTDTFSCEPGQEFMKECNVCVCTADGKNALCTGKLCLQHHTSEE